MAVVLLAGVAAVASRAPLGGSGGSGGVFGGGSATRVPTAWVLALIVAATGVALVTVIYSLQEQKRGGRARGRTARGFGLLSAVQIALIVVAVAVVARLFADRSSNGGRLGHSAAHAPRARHSGGSLFALPGWLPFALLTVLVVVDIVILAVAFAPRRRSGRTDGSVARAVFSAVEESLSDLESDPDPRRAVIAAYRRMELALSRAGLPRRAAESPREYLGRALALLPVSPEPLSTLTRLFESARFSLRRIDASVRDEAIGALRVLRDELEVESGAARA